MTHASAGTLICEDIQDFFPSLNPTVINDIWKGLFHFSPDVAECLTKLTTKDSGLPQGAKTSTFLANLVFWRDEPALVSYLKRHDIEYTRFIDDINCSSKAVLTADALTDVIGRVHAMCSKYGLRLKRTKHVIVMRGSRMSTTNLIIAGRRLNALDSQRLSRVIIRVGARAPVSPDAALVAQARLIQHCGAKHVGPVQHNVLLPYTRQGRKILVQRCRVVDELGINITAEEPVVLGDLMVDACEELVLIVVSVSRSSQVLRASLIR